MKKVFGVSFVRVENGNFNAGFDGLARTDFEGNFFATDKARKYSLRQDFFNNQKEVLIRKHKTKDGKAIDVFIKSKKIQLDGESPLLYITINNIGKENLSKNCMSWVFNILHSSTTANVHFLKGGSP